MATGDGVRRIHESAKAAEQHRSGRLPARGVSVGVALALLLCAGIQVLLFWAVQSSDGRPAGALERGLCFWSPWGHVEGRSKGARRLHDSDGLSEAMAVDRDLPIFFFTAAKPFVGEARERQVQALRSWVRLRPVKEVVLLGDHPSFHEVARLFPPGKVSVEPEIDHNFLGIPQFHSVVARVQAAVARAASPGIYVLSNADIYFLHDFLPVLQKVGSRFRHWVVTGNRWDVIHFPFSLSEREGAGFERNVSGGGGDGGRWDGDEDGAEAAWEWQWQWQWQWQHRETQEVVTDRDVGRFVAEQGTLHTHGGLDFWAWNGGPNSPPLFETQMPPFAYGRGRYDNWMTHEMLHSGSRMVVDASTALTAIHVSHSYAHLTEANDIASSSFAEARGVKNFWSSNKRTNYEADANIFLSRLSGSFREQMGMSLHLPWKLLPCAEVSEGGLCLMYHLKAGTCRCSYSVEAERTQNGMEVHGKGIYCGNVPQEIEVGVELIPKERGLRTPGFPLMMEDLLPHVEDENGTVVLAVGTGREKEMVANLACRLKEMHITLLVSALDEELYRYAFTLGLAVYMEPLRREENFADINCDTDPFCEPELLPVLPAVLHLLKQGKHVVLTDPGLYWVRDPRPFLLSYGSGALLASVLYEEDPPPDALKQFDLRFLFARAERATIQALEAVLNFAVAANITEEESLNAILCGLQGEKWSKTSGCAYDNGLHVIALSANLFPWTPLPSVQQAHEAISRCRASTSFSVDCGELMLNGTLRQTPIWRHDAASQMCVHPWSTKALSDDAVT